MIYYDAIILGAGPAAFSTAISLSKLNCRSVILNKKTNGYITVGQNLDASCKTILSQLNLDPQSLDRVHLPVYHSVSLWDSQKPVWKDSLFNPNGHGWHLDRLNFDTCLLNISKQAGTDYIVCDSINLREIKDQWQINFISEAGKQSLRCRFIIDCTGRSHFVSRKLSIPLLRYDSLISVTSLLSIDSNPAPTESIIESSRDGWWYSACIPGNKRAISFFTNAKTNYFKEYTQLNTFYKKINETSFLKNILQYPDPDKLSDLNFQYANSEKPACVCGNNWISVGDAAAAFDPLSSQGISTALRMGIKAAGAVTAKLASNSTAGLEAYEKTYSDLYTDYLDQRQKYYASVSAWGTSDFWKTNSHSKSFTKTN